MAPEEIATQFLESGRLDPEFTKPLLQQISFFIIDSLRSSIDPDDSAYISELNEACRIIKAKL